MQYVAPYDCCKSFVPFLILANHHDVMQTLSFACEYLPDIPEISSIQFVSILAYIGM